MQDSNKGRKKLLLGIVFLLVIIVLGILFFAKSGDNPGIFKHSSDTLEEDMQTVWGDDSLGISPEVDEALQNYRCIILYGLDNKNRSDIIMFFCIDNKTNKAKVFSVYRDTYMQLDEKEVHEISGKKRDFFKCNHAYKIGGKYMSIAELNRHLDLNARESFGLTWDAVSVLVDMLGGIEVDVTEGMIPWMNGEIRARDGVLIEKPGLQRLNGIQAVQYLRCRKDPGSDATTRAKRNLAVFKQIFEMANKMPDEEKVDIFDTLLSECDTNMSSKALSDTLELLSTVDMEIVGGWPNNYEILWQDDYSYYYYVPQTLETEVSKLHEKVFNQKDYEVTDTVKELSKQIQKNEREQLVHVD